MASQAIITISRSDLAKPLTRPATITDFQELASYTWLNKPSPTISVPGTPPLWSPPATPRRLDPDSGTVYIDQNGARCPSSPLEPLFRALLVEQPDFRLGDVDLVTDRNNLRKLLRFVQASSSSPFRIRVEVAGDGDKATALFTRVEEKTTETIRGFRGYGHSFEKAYTKTFAPGVNGYHRVVSYAFGGLQCVVRHETDGYLGGSKPEAQGADDLLSGALGGLSLAAEQGPETTTSGLTVVRSRDRVDVAAVSSTLEIKTRAASRTLDMADVLPQLWIAQTPNLAVGYHQGGVFNNVQVRDMTDEIRRWEAANQRDLARLAALLAQIISVVKRASDRQAVVEYTGGATLCVLPGDGKPALSRDLYAMWKTTEMGSCGGVEADAGKSTITPAEDTASSIPESEQRLRTASR